MKRNIYLETQAITAAVARVREALDRDTLVQRETVPSHQALGRVLCAPVHARYSAPTTHSAAMDGYALRAADSFAAREGHAVVLEEGTRCFAVNTGQPLPGDCDAVIMIEQVHTLDGGRISIEAPAFPWQHVRRIGEDIVATELLFPRNRMLSAYDIGALLSGGIWEVPVWESLRMRIIPTGSEVLDFTDKPDPGQGQVVESNSQVLCALAMQLGCAVSRVPPVADDPVALRAALNQSLDEGMHITIFCAGSSAGDKDFTRAVIESEGTVLVHGIAAMPGKPTIAGICRGRPVFGAPGYPVSSVVAFEEVMAPLIRWLARREEQRRPELPMELTRKAPSRLGVEEFVRLAVGRVEQKLVATPLGRGAGNITTLTRAQAVMRIPPESEGVAEGATVQGALLCAPEELDSILVCVGSHDNVLDLLADELMGLDTPFRFVSTHVGSMGGITAIKNGSCHLGGMHLFDEATGDFNFPDLKKFLPDVEVAVVNLAIRHQGLIVQKGNPLNIRGVKDLGRKDVRFINRQRGAGTRILLDWHLKEAGMTPADVAGYDKEESTHMAVAVNVLTGAAQCGMGIFAAAHALDIGFVPLARERYDLVAPVKFLHDPRIEAVLNLMRSKNFQARIESLGGYETRLTGQRMAPGMGLG